ncbi:DUF1444 family protein [Flagellimonas sp. 2504JD4-2]
MKKLVSLMLGVFMTSCAQKTQNLTEIQYTERYLEVISSKHPNVTYTVIEPLVLKATYGKDGEVTHYLDNSYSEYRLTPNDLDEIMERYTKASTDIYDWDKDIRVDRIVPIIKPSDYFEQLRDVAHDVEDYKDPDLVWEPYNEGLIIVYAEDRENNIKYFNQKEFDQLNVSRDTLLEFSVNNLNKVIPEIGTVGGNGNYGLVAGGDYEASLILYTELWTKENFEVDGDIVIAIPNRDLVFITGSNDKDNLTKNKAIVQDTYENGNHLVSPNFYKWSGQKFEKFNPM